MFKKNLILFVLLFIGIASNSQTMHVFVFANTNDPKIGETCKVDKEQMLVNIKTVARVLNYEISIKTFDGDNFTAANIRNELNNFSCNKNDIVFFYYTGHGGRSRDDETKWPQLNFNKPNQNVDEYYIPLIAVNNTIDQNNPRLSIVLADCCNSYANITPKVEMKGSTTVSDDDKKDNVYQNLFHKVKGNIIISSSKIGEASYSDNEKV